MTPRPRLVSCPLRPPHVAADEGDKQATEKKAPVSRTCPYLSAVKFGIGTPAPVARLRWPAVALLAIASCAKAPAPESQRHQLPADAPAACPAGMPLPKPLPRPRTVEQLGEWARLTAVAAQATERARAECARDYQRLRDWALGGS